MIKSPASRVTRCLTLTNARNTRSRQSRVCRRVVTMATGAEDTSVAYAAALANVAKSQNKLDAIRSDMDTMTGIVKNNEDLPRYLGSLFIAEDERRNLLTKICKESGFDETTQNFLNLIMDNGRISMLLEICESFDDEYGKLTDTQVATLTSAAELTEEDQYEIAKHLKELCGATNIRLNPVLDESLIAGFILDYGANRIDNSLRGQLRTMSEELAKKNFLG